MSDGCTRFAEHNIGLQIRVTELLDNAILLIYNLFYIYIHFIFFYAQYEDNKIEQYLKCLHLFQMLVHSHYIGF